jgi:hypothetical protein
MLVTLADQCDQKLMQFREEEKVEIEHLKEEKRHLLNMIAQLKQDMESLQSQVDRVKNNKNIATKIYKIIKFVFSIKATH